MRCSSGSDESWFGVEFKCFVLLGRRKVKQGVGAPAVISELRAPASLARVVLATTGEWLASVGHAVKEADCSH